MRRMELKENRIVVKMPKRIHFVSYLIMGKLSHYCTFFIYKLETKIQLKFIDNSIKWCRLILIASKTWLFTMTCKIGIFLWKLVYVIVFWLKYVANCIVANHHLKLHIAKKTAEMVIRIINIWLQNSLIILKDVHETSYGMQFLQTYLKLMYGTLL